MQRIGVAAVASHQNQRAAIYRVFVAGGFLGRPCMIGTLLKTNDEVDFLATWVVGGTSNTELPTLPRFESTVAPTFYNLEKRWPCDRRPPCASTGTWQNGLPCQ